MTIIDYLFFLFVEPLKLLFEVIFFYAYKLTENAGLSIVMISLAINFLLLPLYLRADRLEKEQKNKKEALQHGIDHIKSTFRGDEKVMMLQTYYHQNDYKTTDVFKESVSLFLQIPFFMAAYNFLAGLSILQGVSLGPIPDLGAPDRLITLGAISINLLPVLMTLINIVSSFIYSGKGNIKDNLKLIIIALVFLVLLYNSPSGLVFYWTLNNVFSLCKNIVMHYKKSTGVNKTPAVYPKLRRTNFTIIILSCAALAVMTGIMIPAGIISQNPAEFINTFSGAPHDPSLYIIPSALTAAGAFLIWIPLFVYLMNKGNFSLSAPALAALAVTGIINYILFNRNFGFLSKKLIYPYHMEFEIQDIIINLAADIAVFAVIMFLVMRFKKISLYAVITILAVTAFLAVMYSAVTVIFSSEYNSSYRNKAEDVSIPLSTTGMNTVILMMDKMNSAYIPYIMNERPDVAAQFDGFTYYPNTVSFGKYTNFGAPALFGGYDYTPANINARTEETLASKHNESLLVLPAVFSGNGWTVTVADPSYAGYQWIPDLSIYDGMDGVTAYHMSGLFNDRSDYLQNAGEEYELRLNRNLFCFGFMKTLPLALQPFAYSDGSYNNTDLYYNGYAGSSYTGNSLHTQSGLHEQHIQAYTVLDALSSVTAPTDEDTNCFFMLSNGTTHDICLLQEPEYIAAPVIDNTEYDEAHTDRFTVNGVTMHMDTDYLAYASYECNMEACIALGNWFDCLRANDLYDNTRIIIVSDHGSELRQFDDLLVEDPEFDAQAVNAVLLVKDYNASGFTTSYEFMTNADTPSLALGGIINDPVNPFTGNPINTEPKNGEQLILVSEELNIYTNNGNTFQDPNAYWLSVRDNIYDDDNWSLYEEDPS